MSFPKKQTRFSRSKIVIFVPSTVKDKKVSRKVFMKRIKNTQRFLNTKFGGSTKFRAKGSFILKEGKVVEENVATVEAFIPKDKLTKKDISEVRTFLDDKRETWKQEALAFSFESPKNPAEELHFVEE